MSSYIEVGTIHKTKGFDGSTIVEFTYPLIDDTILAFFTHSFENYSPIVIDTMNLINSHNAEIKWKNYLNKEKAKSLSNTSIYTPEKIAKKHFDIIETNDDNNILNYKIVNSGKILGIVNNIIENKGLSWILVTTEMGQELMIPLNSPHILNISDTNNTIEVSLTDEYIELFTS